MRFSLIKVGRVVIVSALGAVGCVTLLLNWMLPSMKSEFIGSVNKHFSQTITVKKVYFLPPSFVIFQDVAVYDRGDEEPVFVVGLIRAHLSLADVLARKRLSVSRVDCHRFWASDVRFALFLRDNYRQLIEFIRSLPAQDIRVFANDAQLESEDARHASRHYASTDALLEVHNGVVSVEGVVQTREVYQQSRRSVSSLPLACRLRLRLTDRGFLLDNAEVSRANCYIKAWGAMDAGQLSWHGFSFFNTSYNQEEYRAVDTEAPRAFSLVRVARFESVRALPMADADLLILDVNASCLISLPRVEITSLSLAVNNVPLSMKASVTFGTPAALDARISANMSAAGGGRAFKGIKKVDAFLKGYFQNAVFKGDGALNLFLSREEKSNNPLDKVSISFHEAEIFLGSTGTQVVHLGRVNVGCQSPSTHYAVDLDKGVAVIRHLRKKLFDIKFNALLYDGRMRAKVSLDADSFPPRVESIMVLKDLDAQRLDKVLVHFSKVFGRMFGQLRFVSWPKPVLKGNVCIQQGSLRDFEFFGWLSEQFALPSLRRVAFARTSLAFTVKRAGSSMHLIDLVSRDVRLGGYFQLDTKNFVSSKISLALGRDILKESPKGKGLVGMLKGGQQYLDFDFQLSGPLHSMNFQWLESDSKKRLQESIPNFIERKLEKNIENMLAPQAR